MAAEEQTQQPDDMESTGPTFEDAQKALKDDPDYIAADEQERFEMELAKLAELQNAVGAATVIGKTSSKEVDAEEVEPDPAEELPPAEESAPAEEPFDILRDTQELFDAGRQVEEASLVAQEQEQDPATVPPSQHVPPPPQAALAVPAAKQRRQPQKVYLPGEEEPDGHTGPASLSDFLPESLMARVQDKGGRPPITPLARLQQQMGATVAAGGEIGKQPMKLSVPVLADGGLEVEYFCQNPSCDVTGRTLVDPALWKQGKVKIQCPECQYVMNQFDGSLECKKER